MPRRRPTQLTSRAPTPSRDVPGDGAMARGEGLFGQGTHHARAERGTVVLADANRHVYQVALNSGRVLNGVPRLRTHPGDVALLAHGTPVRVDFSLGQPYIDGILPLETAAPTDEQVASVTDTSGHGGQDPSLDRNLGATARAGGEPNDLIPGDFVGAGPDGSVLAALRGKIALLRGSSLAQVRAFGDTDLVEVLTGLYRVVTWMGEARVVNDGGRTSYIWRGGADQVTQTGADTEQYTLRLDVGATGNLFRFEVTTPDGHPVARIAIDPAGHGELFFAGGLDQHAGSAGDQVHPATFFGERRVAVAGGDRLTISGDASHAVAGGLDASTGATETRTVGQDYGLTVNRDADESVGGDKAVSVQGAYRTVVLGGDHTVDVRADHSFRVLTATGDQVFTPASGKFRVVTRGDDAVELTDTPEDHVTKYNALRTLLETLRNDYNEKMALLAAATYPVTGGVAGPDAGLAALAIPLEIDWTPAQSRIVKVG